MLVVIPQRERVEQSRLHAEMERKQEGKGSTDTSPVQVHIGVGIVVRALLRLRVAHLQTILHAEVVLLFLGFFPRGVEEGVVRRLQIGLTTHLLRLYGHRRTTHNKYI